MDYDAQRVVYNVTIQHTVAAALDGVTPERVTEISLEEEKEQGNNDRLRGTGGKPQLAAAESALILRYKITVNDPQLTVDWLRASLTQAAQEGKMDRDLRFYADTFGAMNLNNGTFAEPQVTSAVVDRGTSERLTGVMIACLVVGVVMFFGLLAAVVHLIRLSLQAEATRAVDGGEEANVVF